MKTDGGGHGYLYTLIHSRRFPDEKENRLKKKKRKTEYTYEYSSSVIYSGTTKPTSLEKA